ncbi:LysR family transcriptional regulator, partial [Rhizobium johnstonii]
MTESAAKTLVPVLLISFPGEDRLGH